jgi:LMBR1 domain-containing protein 1
MSPKFPFVAIAPYFPPVIRDKAIFFTSGLAMILSQIFTFPYMVIGLSTLPFFILKYSGSDRLVRLRETLDAITEKKDSLKSKRGLSRKEYKELLHLEKQEKKLFRYIHSETENLESTVWYPILSQTFYRRTLGFIGLVLTLVFLWSLLMSVTDRMAFSPCRGKCGFLVSLISLFHPLEALAYPFLNVFGLDLTFINLFLYCVLVPSVWAFTYHGFPYLNLHDIEFLLKRTSNAGIIFLAFFTCSTLIGSLPLFYYTFPQYSTYATQTYVSLTCFDSSAMPQ